MAIYIALLRGINVGGKNLIKMADLQHLLVGMGFGRVQTYIQSGNVLFESDQEAEALHQNISREIERVFGFTVAVILRTAPELEQIISNCPFSAEAISAAEAAGEGESLYVALLLQAPLPEKIERWSAYDNQGDAYHIEGRDIFLLFQHSIRDSKLASNLHRLEAPATVRNWKTLTKLAELAKGMGD